MVSTSSMIVITCNNRPIIKIWSCFLNDEICLRAINWLLCMDSGNGNTVMLSFDDKGNNIGFGVTAL